MRSIIIRILTLLLLLSFFIFCGCSEGGFSNEKTSESNEKIVVLSQCSEEKMHIYRAIFQETGFDPVIEASYDSERHIYTDVKLNTYYAAGFLRYYYLSEEEYKSIQDYQNRTGIQVIYPTVKYQDRPRQEKFKSNANIFYKIDNSKSARLVPVLDQNGKLILNYWAYAVGSEKPALAEEYNSIRIEGESGVNIDGTNYYYVYGRTVEHGIEVRVFRYAYYEYLKQTQPDSLPPEELIFGFN